MYYTPTNNKYLVDLKNVNKVVLSFNTDVKYDKIEYVIKNVNGSEEKTYEASLTGAGTYTNTTAIDITGWLTGNYIITWKAWHYTQGNAPYTYTKYMQLEESE